MDLHPSQLFESVDSDLSKCSSPRPSEEDFYRSPKTFESQRLSFTAITSAEQDIACFDAIYMYEEDSSSRNSWFNDSLLAEVLPDTQNTPIEIERYRERNGCEAIFESQRDIVRKRSSELFKEKEAKGYYGLPHSFPNYVIKDKDNGEMAGKIIFQCADKKTGRVENGIYILKGYRRANRSSEALLAVKDHVIQPALGKKFYFSSMSFNKFEGMYAKVMPWHNYPSLSAYCKAGWVARWDRVPSLFYPPGNESHLTAEKDLDAFLDLISKLHFEAEEWASYAKHPCEDCFAFLSLMRDNVSDDTFNQISGPLLILKKTAETKTAAFAKEALTSLIGESEPNSTEEDSEDEEDNERKRKYLRSEHESTL